MRDYIDRLASGIFDYNVPSVETINPIYADIIEKTQMKGAFDIPSTGPIDGNCVSTDIRVRVELSFDNNQAKVNYIVDASDSEPEDLIKGFINIITTAGRISVPYEFRVTRRSVNIDGYLVDDLSSFAVLAGQDNFKALDFFVKEDFRTIVLREDLRLNALYDQLMLNTDIPFAMTAFLKESGCQHIVEENVPITALNEETLNEEENDLIMSAYSKKASFSVFINEWKKIKIHIIKTYLDFRINNISKEEWVNESLAIISDTDFLSLYNFGAHEKVSYLEVALTRALLLAFKGEAEEARRVLKNYEEAIIKDTKTNGLLYYAAIYIKSLSSPQSKDVSYTRQEFDEAIEKKEAPWQVFIFRYHMDKDSEKNASAWLAHFKDAFNEGCISPILYLEAIRIFNKHPELLRVMNDFETQVFRFGYRYSLVEKDAGQRFASILAEENKVDEINLWSLRQYFKTNSSERVLNVLSSKLIQAHMVGPIYAQVYEIAIKQGLNITGLYEFYIRSLHDTIPRPIPAAVLSYFRDVNTLDNNGLAYLYACAIVMRNEEADLFMYFRDRIVEFARERLSKGFIDDNLVIIYRWLWDKPEFIDESLALQVFRLQYTYRLTFTTNKVKSLLVRHVEFNNARKISVKDKKTYAFLMVDPVDMNKDCLLSVEDEDGKIHIISDFEYNIERVLEGKKYIHMTNPACISDPFFNLSEYKIAKTSSNQSEDRYAKNLLAFDELSYIFEKKIKAYVFKNEENDVNEDIYQDIEKDIKLPESVSIKSKASRIVGLEEELAQLLFVKASLEEMEPVFTSLISMKAEGKVIDAYIAYQSYLYFVKEEACDTRIFNIILDRLKEGRKQLPVELISLLKEEGCKKNLTKESLELCEELLAAFIKRGCIFAFYKDLNEKINLPFYLWDKTIIEFKDRPEEDVWIDFKSGRYEGKRVRANETCCGIYTYPIILFAGEAIEFNVVAKEKNEEPVTIEGRIVYDGKPRGNNKDFASLNQMGIDLRQQGVEVIKESLEDYLRNEYINKRLFEPM